MDVHNALPERYGSDCAARREDTWAGTSQQGAFTREDRVRYRQKVRRCLDVFALMLDDFGFDADRPMTGLEIELNLVDPAAEPAMRNDEILADIADPLFQTELGQFNLELNARPG